MADLLHDDRIVHDGVTIAMAPPAARYSLRLRPIPGSRPVAGGALPPILASAPLAGGGHALGLGPDEWLLILSADAPPPQVDGAHALIDIGHRDIGLTIEGPRAAMLLQSGIALDLSEAAFPIGKATRTLSDGVAILLWRTGAQAFRVETGRSFAEHVRGCLARAAANL